MRYNLVPLVATTVFALASANVQIPDGCTHDDSWGNAIVENQCSFDVYYVLDNVAGGKQTISGGSNIKVPIYEKSDKGGMNIKLFKDPDTDLWSVPSLTQFELTATTQIFYDISNVNSDIGSGKNGNGEKCDKEPPFMQDGLKMSDGKNSVSCAPGENPCKLAYSNWNDDYATTSTALSNDVTLTICPGGQSSSQKSSGDSSSSPSKPDTPAAPQEAKKPAKAADKAADTTKPAEKPKVKVEEKVQKPDDQAEAEVVYVTQIVKAAAAQQTVYVHAAAEAKEKRQEHIHQHAHNKIHKRRHEA